MLPAAFTRVGADAPRAATVCVQDSQTRGVTAKSGVNFWRAEGSFFASAEVLRLDRIQAASFLRSKPYLPIPDRPPAFPDPQTLRRCLLNAPSTTWEHPHRAKDRLPRKLVHLPEHPFAADLRSGWNGGDRVWQAKFNPLLCLEANSSFLWDAELRSGNASAWESGPALLISGSSSCRGTAHCISQGLLARSGIRTCQRALGTCRDAVSRTRLDARPPHCGGTPAYRIRRCRHHLVHHGPLSVSEVIRLAYNLVTAFQRTCLTESRQSHTLRKLGFKLFLLPGELTRPRNRPTLRLQQWPPIQRLVDDVLARILLSPRCEERQTGDLHAAFRFLLSTCSTGQAHTSSFHLVLRTCVSHRLNLTVAISFIERGPTSLAPEPVLQHCVPVPSARSYRLCAPSTLS